MVSTVDAQASSLLKNWSTSVTWKRPIAAAW